MNEDGLTLQETIRFAVRQRNIARSRGYHDVAAFWDNELWTLRSQVPAKVHSPIRAWEIA